MTLLYQLRRDEGVRYAAYRDSLGNWTTGVGHLICPDEGWLLTATLSDDQVDTLLTHDVADKQRQLVAFDWYNNLDDIRQAAICNMAFNLGVHGLLGFPSMIHALAGKDWQEAHDQALASVWATQVGERATRIASQLLLGEWV